MISVFLFLNLNFLIQCSFAHRSNFILKFSFFFTYFLGARKSLIFFPYLNDNPKDSRVKNNKETERTNGKWLGVYLMKPKWMPFLISHFVSQNEIKKDKDNKNKQFTWMNLIDFYLIKLWKQKHLSSQEWINKSVA